MAQKMTPIARIRDHLHLSQAAFGKAVGTQQAEISRMENTKRRVKPSRTVALAIWVGWRSDLHELRITLEDLLRNEASDG